MCMATYNYIAMRLLLSEHEWVQYNESTVEWNMEVPAEWLRRMFLLQVWDGSSKLSNC